MKDVGLVIYVLLKICIHDERCNPGCIRISEDMLVFLMKDVRLGIYVLLKICIPNERCTPGDICTSEDMYS